MWMGSVKLMIGGSVNGGRVVCFASAIAAGGLRNGENYGYL